MEPRYQILSTLYTIAKADQQPESYGCRPRELILRLWQDWNSIKSELEILQKEGLVTLKQRDTLVINITTTGIEKAFILSEATSPR